MVKRVKDLMVTNVLTIPLTATVTEASQMLREREVTGAPVVDERGRPVGVISRTDLAHGWERSEAQRQRAYYRTAAGEPPPATDEVPTKFGERLVSDAMMSLTFSVQEDDSVRKAAALMSAEGVHRVIVLNGVRLVGVLSASDIVAAVGRGELVEPR